MYFQKMQFLEVFRPFFQRSLTYYKFLSRSSSSHTKGKSWASHQLKKMFALLASYFIFAEERAREKRNTIAMVNYTDDGRVIAISQFFYGQYQIWELFGSHMF